MPAKRISQAEATQRALDVLERIDPETRLLRLLGLIEELEQSIAAARQARSDTILELRRPAVYGGKYGYTWAALAELTGRKISYQAVEQWTRPNRTPKG